MQELKKSIQHTLYDLGYNTDFLMNQSVFTKRGLNLPLFISILLGCVTLALGIIINYYFILLAILLIGLPFVYDDWRFPKTVDFDYHNELLKIKKSSFRQHEMEYESIDKIFYEKSVLSGQVSRFQEGNKDYVFKFYVKLKVGTNHRLLIVKTRKDIAEQMQELQKFLNFSSKKG